MENHQSSNNSAEFVPPSPSFEDFEESPELEDMESFSIHDWVLQDYRHVEEPGIRSDS